MKNGHLKKAVEFCRPFPRTWRVTQFAFVLMVGISFLWTGWWHHEKHSSMNKITNAYWSLMESSSTAFTLVDQNGIVNAWASGSEELFGIKRGDIIGKNIDVIIPDNMKELHHLGMAQGKLDSKNAKPRKSVFVIECDAIGIDGIFPACVTVRTINDPRIGGVRYLAMINRQSDVRQLDAVREFPQPVPNQKVADQ